MRVLLVDDHPLMLSALQTVIEGLGDEVAVEGLDSADAARAALARCPDADLLLLDLALGRTSGFDFLVELRTTHPALPVVVISASDRMADVIRAIDLGAMGFVPKHLSRTDLLAALRTVLGGAVYVPAALSGMRPPADDDVLPMLPHGDLPPPAPVPRAPPSPMPTHAASMPSIDALSLTPRQAEVLELLLQGLPNKLIARQLNLSVETVKDHVAAVLRALDVGTRTQAVLAVSRLHRDGANVPRR